MRVTRLLITGFRGWERLDLRPDGHVLLAGVPRAGRTDIIMALARVLDPHVARNPLLSDLHQECPAPGADENGASNTPAVGTRRVECAEVEVTLTDFDPNVQQLFDDGYRSYLEPLDPSGKVSEDLDADPTAAQCVRLTYRLTYDGATEALDPIVYFPAGSDPAVGKFARVPAATRRALPVLILKAGLPMQLRAEGNLRRVIDERDSDAALAAFETLRDAVADAVSTLSADPAVTGAVDAVLNVGGIGMRLGDATVTAAEIGFLTEDGSVGALLRTLRAAARLDAAGLLELANHGSTATAVLAVAEAIILASVPGAIVLADDFGDQLDAAAAEHLAALLRARSGQLWLSTRRPDVARAFEPGELVRLVRHGSVRTHHQLAKITDRKALTAMRQLHTQLLAAVTAPTVAITEGPHDVAVYSMVDRRYPPDHLPLLAYGVRLVAAGTGQDGGIDQIPRVADLARQLGFRVLAVIDRDKDSTQAASQLAKIQAACNIVIRLPNGAIERAMLAGIDLDKIVAASATLTEYGIGHAQVIDLARQARRQRNTVSIFTHTIAATMAVSDALTAAGLRHEQVGFGEAYGEALQAQLALAQFALGDTSAPLRRTLAVYITATCGGRKTSPPPPLAQQLLDRTNPILERALGQLITDLQPAAGDSPDLDRLAKLVAGAYARIGTFRGQETWIQAAQRTRSTLRMAGDDPSLATVTAELLRARDETLVGNLTHRRHPIQVMNLHQTKGREADTTILLLGPDEFYGYESEPYPEGSCLLYVVMTRARHQAHLVVPANPHPLWQPLVMACGLRG